MCDGTDRRSKTDHVVLVPMYVDGSFVAFAMILLQASLQIFLSKTGQIYNLYKPYVCAHCLFGTIFLHALLIFMH